MKRRCEEMLSLADKAHIHLLDEQQVGMFSDDTRCHQSSVFEAEEPGFANGGKDLEEQILASCESLVRTKGAESESTISG